MDELMNDQEIPEVIEVFFQFEDDEPIKFANVTGKEFSLTLQAVEEVEEPTVIFSDGKGKSFKMFLRK